MDRRLRAPAPDQGRERPGPAPRDQGVPDRDPPPLVDGRGPDDVGGQRRPARAERPGDTVELVITMDSENYAPHALPARTERTWSREELGKLDPDAADGYLKAEEWGFALHAALGTPLGGIEGAALATAILARGILTD